MSLKNSGHSLRIAVLLSPSVLKKRSLSTAYDPYGMRRLVVISSQSLKSTLRLIIHICMTTDRDSDRIVSCSHVADISESFKTFCRTNVISISHFFFFLTFKRREILIINFIYSFVHDIHTIISNEKTTLRDFLANFLKKMFAQYYIIMICLAIVQ